MKNYLFLWILLVGSVVVLAQYERVQPIASLSYVNQGGNYLKVGGGMLIEQNNRNAFQVMGNAHLGYMRDKWIVIPELGISYLFNFKSMNNQGFMGSNHPFFQYVIRTNVSPWTITPEIGFQLFRYLEYTMGYAAEFDEPNEFKSLQGFRVNFGILIPF